MKKKLTREQWDEALQQYGSHQLNLILEPILPDMHDRADAIESIIDGEEYEDYLKKP